MGVGRSWLLAAVLALGAGPSLAQSSAEAVVAQLRVQGYVEFAVSRTLLGRIRIVALAPDGSQREIVFNPATGEILRDYQAVAEGQAPQILDRSTVGGRPQPSSPPPRSSGRDDPPQSASDEDGDRGHVNDPDGVDGDNPGQGPDNRPGNSAGHGPPDRHGK